MESTYDRDLQIIKPRPNPIFGSLVSLSYQGNGNNLVEIEIQENNFGEIFTFTAYCNVNTDFNIIKILNLHEFQFRLQEAFNFGFLVSIFYEGEKIVVFKLISRVQRIGFPPRRPKEED